MMGFQLQVGKKEPEARVAFLGDKINQRWRGFGRFGRKIEENDRGNLNLSTRGNARTFDIYIYITLISGMI